MTWKRKIAYSILRPIVKLFITSFWWTCRVEKVIGDEHTLKLLEKGDPIIPCYWHQMLIFGAWYMRKLQKRGLKIGFLISPSVDGEIAAKMVQSWGAVAIRGSSNRTGARALKDMYNTIVKDKVSPVTTSDGPTGPVHEFKQGAVMLAQLTQTPMLPIAYAASRYWELKSWDKFIIPKPFSRIVVAVSESHYIAKKLTAEQMEEERIKMQDELNNLILVAKAALKKDE